MNADGSILNKYQNTELKWSRGICIDGDGDIIVCCENSNEVHVVTGDEVKNKTLLSSRDSIIRPSSVANNNGNLIIGCWDNAKLFVYTVE